MKGTQLAQVRVRSMIIWPGKSCSYSTLIRKLITKFKMTKIMRVSSSIERLSNNWMHLIWEHISSQMLGIGLD